MTRKLKAFGVAMGVVLAICATGATAAQAFQFKTDAGFTEIKGAGKAHKLAFDGGTLECANFNATSSLAGAPSESLVAEGVGYSGCEFFAGGFKFNAVVDMNSCTYLFMQDKNTGNGEFDVTTKISCPAGKDITVTALSGAVDKCTIHIPEQELGTGVAMLNGMAAGVKDITATFGLSKIKYDQTAGSGIGACATADATNNGTYGGNATFTGSKPIGEGGAPKNLWVE